MVTALPLRVTLAVAGGLGMDFAGCVHLHVAHLGEACGGEEGATGGGCQGAEEHG